MLSVVVDKEQQDKEGDRPHDEGIHVVPETEWHCAGGGLERPDKDKDEDKEDDHPPPLHTGAIMTVLSKKFYKEGKRVHIRILCA